MKLASIMKLSFFWLWTTDYVSRVSPHLIIAAYLRTSSKPSYMEAFSMFGGPLGRGPPSFLPLFSFS